MDMFESLSSGNMSQMIVQSQRTNLCSVVCSTEDEFRGSVITGADIGDIRFPTNKVLSTPKITQLENPSLRIKQEVLGLDISMANAQ